MENIKYMIKSPILLDVFNGLGGCIDSRKCPGYLSAIGSNPRISCSRYLLEYIVSSIFDIHRLTESLLSNCSYSGYLREVLTENMIIDAINEYSIMYRHIQKMLSIDTSPYIKNKYIKVRRTLTKREAKIVMPQYFDDEKDKICLPVNIVTSYSYDSYDGCYEDSGVYLDRFISNADICYVDKYVSYEGECLWGRSEKEVLAVDRSIFGEIHVNKDCFRIDMDKVDKEDYKTCESFSRLHPDEQTYRKLVEKLFNYEDNETRAFPCQKNRFIRWCLKKQKN